MPRIHGRWWKVEGFPRVGVRRRGQDAGEGPLPGRKRDLNVERPVLRRVFRAGKAQRGGKWSGPAAAVLAVIPLAALIPLFLERGHEAAALGLFAGLASAGAGLRA